MEKLEPRDILQREARWPDGSVQIEASSGHLLEPGPARFSYFTRGGSQNPLILGQGRSGSDRSRPNDL